MASREELSQPSSACDAKNAQRELPPSTLSSSSSVLTTPPAAPSCPSGTSPGQKEARVLGGNHRRGRGDHRQLWGWSRTQGRQHRAEGEGTGGVSGNLSTSFVFSLFKNKLRSSGRGEVGGNACAGGEGGRAGQRPAARKTIPHHSPRARKKPVEHPHSQEAPEPGKSHLPFLML